MKKLKTILCVVLCFVLLFSFVGCDGNTDDNKVPVSIISIKGTGVSGGKITMFADTSVTLTALVAPSNATNKTVTWTSDNSAIATVDNAGKLTAVKAGSTTIKASADGKVATLSVIVKAKTQLTSLTFKADNYDIFAQKTTAVTMAMMNELVYAPNDVTYKAVTWTLEPIDNADVTQLTVDATGELAVIKEKATLNAKYTLTATSVDQSSIFASTTITIKHVEATSATIRYTHQPAAATKPYEFPLSYKIYDNLNVIAEPQPAGAMDEFVYSSSSSDVVAIETDSKYTYGTFTVKNIGSATLTATSRANSNINVSVVVNIVADKPDETSILVDQANRANNLNVTAKQLLDAKLDNRQVWNFDPEGEKYKTDRAASIANWNNFPSKQEMMNSGNGQSTFDAGYGIALDSWDWPQDNEQTNLYIYNKITVPMDKQILKLRVRTQTEGGTSGKGKFRVRLVDLDTYQSTFLQKDALVSVGADFEKPERAAADMGVQDAVSNWIYIDSVPDFTIGMDWFHFTVPQEYKGKNTVLFFEVDDIHTKDIGTDGCDRIILVCAYFAANNNPDPNTLRKEG